MWCDVARRGVLIRGIALYYTEWFTINTAQLFHRISFTFTALKQITCFWRIQGPAFVETDAEAGGHTW